MTLPTTHTALNRNGVKDSADMWRTVNGERFIQWTAFASDERVRAYRAAGVRCRRFVGEMFIHHEDRAQAAAFVAKLGDE